MTGRKSAPERIWASPEGEYGYENLRMKTWEDVQLYRDGVEHAYIHEDIADARVAAALEKAAKSLESSVDDWRCDESESSDMIAQRIADEVPVIRDLATDQERDALDRIVAEAVKAERERCASVAAAIRVTGTCRKCGATMRPGKALAQTMVGGMLDFPGDKGPVTFSAGGPGKIVDCMKCSACGWSVTKGDEDDLGAVD